MIPPWLPILRDALDLEFAASPRIATLATVDEQHHPHARSVVLRQLDDDGALHITSDARSEKNAQLRASSLAELVLWLPNRREQFRLAGFAHVITRADNAALIDHFWNLLPDTTRAQFTWPAPGRPWQGCDNAFEPAVPATRHVPESFEVVTLRPDAVDHLQLTTTPHRRTRYWLTHSAWRPEDVNP